MRTPLVMLLLIAAGCSGTTGPTGAQGPEGPQGVPGPRGDPGGVYVYVDADGKEVDTDHSLIWTDVNGWQWYIDPATAAVRSQDYNGGYYENTDCSGERYTSNSFLPRRPLQRNDNTYWAREDAATPASTNVRSLADATSGACHLWFGDKVVAYRLVKVDGLTPPTLPYRAPLRLERRR